MTYTLLPSLRPSSMVYPCYLRCYVDGGSSSSLLHPGRFSHAQRADAQNRYPLQSNGAPEKNPTTAPSSCTAAVDHFSTNQNPSLAPECKLGLKLGLLISKYSTTQVAPEPGAKTRLATEHVSRFGSDIKDVPGEEREGKPAEAPVKTKDGSSSKRRRRLLNQDGHLPLHIGWVNHGVASVAVHAHMLCMGG